MTRCNDLALEVHEISIACQPFTLLTIVGVYWNNINTEIVYLPILPTNFLDPYDCQYCPPLFHNTNMQRVYVWKEYECGCGCVVCMWVGGCEWVVRCVGVLQTCVLVWVYRVECGCCVM